METLEEHLTHLHAQQAAASIAVMALLRTSTDIEALPGEFDRITAPYLAGLMGRNPSLRTNAFAEAVQAQLDEWLLVARTPASNPPHEADGTSTSPTR